jgi:hypothetical protein
VEEKTGTGFMSGSMQGAYEASFGFMKDQTIYFSPFEGIAGKVDMRPELKALVEKGMDAQLKALSVAGMGAGTAGASLVPVFVDGVITDRSRKFTPWTELLQRVSNQGVTADFNYISSKGAAFTASEDAALSDVSDTEARSSTSIKYLYSVGRVTGVTFSAMPSYIVAGSQVSGTGAATATFGNQSAGNAKQYEVIKRANALKELEENLIWNGNATTSGITGNPNGTEFSGIITLQSTTNRVDKGTTAAIEYADIETACGYAYDDSGRPGIAGCDRATLTDIRKILLDQFRYSPNQLTGTAGFGVPASVVLETMLGPIPVVPSQYISTTTGSKAIYFLDQEHIEMRVLQDMTYEDLAKTNDSQKFMLKMYEAMIMRNTSFNAFVGRIL